MRAANTEKQMATRRLGLKLEFSRANSHAEQ